jgi:hypothetical protein
VNEKVGKALQAYSHTPAREPALTNSVDVLVAIFGPTGGKAPGPSGLTNRVLKHIPKRATCFLVALFNAALLAQYFPSIWKHARVISILKTRTDPSLLSSYLPISLLYTIGKLFEKILLSRMLSELRGRGLLRDEKFAFRPKHSVSLQLARLLERVTRNFARRY